MGEDVRVPMATLALELMGARHVCGRKLFSFVNRSLNAHGFRAVVQRVELATIEFLVEPV